MLLTLLSFLSRLSILVLMTLFSSVFLWAEEDTLEETEEATGPLQIKQQTALCSADYYIRGGTGDKEEDRKRKNIGIGEKITFLLVGKPKGTIKELKWDIEGDGFKQVNNEQLQGELKIALTAKEDLEKDATAKIKAETSEGQKAEITINIRIPKKLKKEKFEGIIDMGDGNPISTDMFQFSKGEHGLLGFIQLTLSPTNVSFKKIKIIERDGGLMWEGKNSKPPKTKPELANEHKTCNLAGSVGNKNHFYDMVGDNRLIEEIIETIKNSKYNPQKFWFVCKLYVHKGQGGEGSRKRSEEQVKKLKQLSMRELKILINNGESFIEARNVMVEDEVKHLEKVFMELLVSEFPGQYSKVEEFLLQSGYTREDIPNLIDHTVGREPQTDFLYQGRHRVEHDRLLKKKGKK